MAFSVLMLALLNFIVNKVLALLRLALLSFVSIVRVVLLLGLRWLVGWSS